MTSQLNTPPMGTPPDNLSKRDYIEIEKVRKSYAHLPLGFLGTISGAVVLFFALRSVVPFSRLGVWLGLIVCATFLRFIHYLYYNRIANSVNRTVLWKHQFYASILISGIVWGSGGFFLFPPESFMHQVFLAFILGGMIASSMGVYSILETTFWLFSLPVLLPLVVRFFAAGDPHSTAMGMMLVIFWGLMLFAARGFSRTMTDTMALRFQNLGLISDLRSEISERKNAEAKLQDQQRKIELTVQERTAAFQAANEKLSQEITWRKKTEEALRESEEKYRDFVENINDAIYSFSISGEVTYISPPIEAILGYHPDEFIGKSFNTLIHPEDKVLVKDRFRQIVNGDIRPMEYRVEQKKGGYRWVQVSSRPLRKNGEVIGIQGVLRDLDEKKNLEAKLQQALKMEAIGAVAGGVAHDLNNILSGLVSYPQLLLMELAEDSPLRGFVETIQKSGEKAAAIVQDLLTLTRRGVLSMAPVPINRVIEEYLASPEYDHLMRHHSEIRVSFCPEANLLNIMGSRIHLSKTIMNLVTNAAEAIPATGEIVITTKNRHVELTESVQMEAGDYVVVRIADNGDGIDSIDLERIFEPFFTKKKAGRSGTGLGMAVVWGTVQDHKGHIDVKSTPGKGTTFSLYLPATYQGESTERIRDLEHYQGNGETILVVDDIEEQRNIARAILTKFEYCVTTAASGEEAIDIVKQRSFDLLLLDMIMSPGIDGLETYQQITTIRPSQKAIIVSGYSETDRVKQVQKLGAAAYLKKPYLVGSLGRVVHQALK